MSLLGSIIVSVCVGTAPGSYPTACSAALDAGTRQSGFDKDFETVERNGSRYGTYLYEENVPENAKPFLGSLVFLAKTAIDRRVDVPLPTLGVCDKVVTELTPSSAIISMKWGF